MRFCTNCGSQVSDNNQFCHECGERISGPSQAYTNTGSYNTYQAPTNTVSKKNSIISFILGLVNIELMIFCIFPYVCFVFFPGCLIISIFGIKKAGQYKAEAGRSNAFATIGKVVSIVTLAIASFLFIFGLILTFDPVASEAFIDGFLYGYTGGLYGDLGGDGYYDSTYYF